jgi:hypothetical protein
MQVIVKNVISVAVILRTTAIGKRLPSMAGLIGVMPRMNFAAPGASP